MKMEDPDVVVHLSLRKMTHVMYKFKDGTFMSPTEASEKIMKLIEDNPREVRDTVGRMSDLVISPFPAGQWKIFALGYYMRKTLAAAEEKHGPGKIVTETDLVPREDARKKLAEIIEAQAEKMKRMAVNVRKGALDDSFGEEEQEGFED